MTLLQVYWYNRYSGVASFKLAVGRTWRSRRIWVWSCGMARYTAALPTSNLTSFLTSFPLPTAKQFHLISPFTQRSSQLSLCSLLRWAYYGRRTLLLHTTLQRSHWACPDKLKETLCVLSVRALLPITVALKKEELDAKFFIIICFWNGYGIPVFCVFCSFFFFS